MFKNIKTIFSHTKRVLWPQFDHVHQIQSCIDSMCLFYGIPHVHVRMFPKWYIEKYVEHAIAVATFWPSNEDEDLFYEVWFCTEHFGYPCKTITPKRGKPFRARIPCERCTGLGFVERMAMQYCEVPECGNESFHECKGAFCWGNGWVCDEHWTEENIGFSESGFACSTCCDEVGSGGH